MNSTTQRPTSGRSSEGWIKLTKMFIAELFGTAVLVTFGCMNLALLPTGLPSILHIGFGFGLVCASLVMILGRISGCFINPAVTLAGLLCNRLTILQACLYFIAQLLGSIIGYAAVLSCNPTEYLCVESICKMCVTHPINTVTPVQAAIVEFYGTGLLILVVCSIWDPYKEANDSASAIKIAIAVTGIVCATAEYSGASLNPARSFGPALLTGHWENQWVYWVGPLGGAIVCSLFYRFILQGTPNVSEPLPS